MALLSFVLIIVQIRRAMVLPCPHFVFNHCTNPGGAYHTPNTKVIHPDIGAYAIRPYKESSYRNVSRKTPPTGYATIRLL